MLRNPIADAKEVTMPCCKSGGHPVNTA